MDYDRYVEATQQGARLMEDGDLEGALAVFRGLVASDISEIDRSMMAYNTAVILEKLGRERETREAYRQAMDLERRHGRSFVAEHHAAYLARIARVRDSLHAYEDLLRRPSLTEEEKNRLRQNVDYLRSQMA